MLPVGAAARWSGRRPQVYVVDGRVLVYDPESVAALLTEHRIWATPVGVRRARNNSPEHSFPCVLSQQQATLVLRRHLADVSYPCHSSTPEAGHNRRETLEENDGDDGDRGAEHQEERDVPMNRTKSCSIPPRLLSSEWRFPETAAERKSMAVFEDLWAKGLCSASGSNYGADFVVYDGPPTERHSIAAVIVSRGANDELPPAEVSGFARVQQAVGKRAVIATAPLGTNDTTPVVVGACKPAVAASVLSDDIVGKTGGAGWTTAPRRHESGQETASAAIPAMASGGPALAAAGAGAAANEGVRYITLQFHSVSSRA